MFGPDELPGWSKWQFFTTPKASLGGRTPLDALKTVADMLTDAEDSRYAEVAHLFRPLSGPAQPIAI